MATQYDLTVLLDPTAPEERQEEILQEIRAMIEAGGALLGDHDWGTRRLAYEIDHREEASYRLFQFEGGNELLEKLRHTLRISDGVLRHRVIRVKAGSSAPPDPASDTGARREQKGGDTQVAPRAAADAPA